MLVSGRCYNVLLFSKNRCESTDLGSEGSSNVLGGVRHEVLYSSHDIIKEGGSVNKLAETYSLLSTIVAPQAMPIPGICPAIAVRTSASVSLSNLTNAGTRSLVTTSSSTAFAIWARSVNNPMD